MSKHARFVYTSRAPCSVFSHDTRSGIPRPHVGPRGEVINKEKVSSSSYTAPGANHMLNPDAGVARDVL